VNTAVKAATGLGGVRIEKTPPFGNIGDRTARIAVDEGLRLLVKTPGQAIRRLQMPVRSRP
jgi:hypothetical protein